MKCLKKITKLYQVTVAYVIFVQIGDEQDYIPISTLKYYIFTFNTACIPLFSKLSASSFHHSYYIATITKSQRILPTFTRRLNLCAHLVCINMLLVKQ